MSARFDRTLRDKHDDEDIDYDIADESRGDRWWRRGRSFIFFGVVAALLVPSLYPWWVHYIWRLLPWVYFGKRWRGDRARRRKLRAFLDKPSVPPS